MSQFDQQRAIVVGASRGVGREIVRQLVAAGAQVLALGRNESALATLAREIPGTQTLVADMQDPQAPAAAFARMQPNILIVAGGASPKTGSFQDMNWSDFSLPWETDTKGTFSFCKAAVLSPLKPGSKVLVLSSGAGLGGSPASGGYAGAKRMQMFLTNYAQSESDNNGLGIHFATLVIKQIMGETEIGRAAAEAYAVRAGISVAEFLTRFNPAITPVDVASAALEILGSEKIESGTGFAISGQGLEAL